MIEKQRTEHRARVRDPGTFQPGSFRRKKITEGVSIIIGRLKGRTTTTTQAYRFSREVFTVTQAKKWLKDRKISITGFEAATAKESVMADKNIEKSIHGLVLEALDSMMPMVEQASQAVSSLASAMEALRVSVKADSPRPQGPKPQPGDQPGAQPPPPPPPDGTQAQASTFYERSGFQETQKVCGSCNSFAFGAADQKRVQGWCLIHDKTVSAYSYCNRYESVQKEEKIEDKDV